LSVPLCDHHHIERAAEVWSWGLPLSIFGASLLGSLHCAGMCTGLLASLTSGARARASFHVGRGASYTGLGALAGAFGAKLFPGKTGLPAPFESVALLLFIAALLVLGLQSLGSVHLAWPAPIARRVTAFYAKVVKPGSTGLGVPFFGGLLLPLLPCGWLYAFVLGAASTGSATRGAVSLFAFYLGTIPALEFSASLFQRMLGPVARRVPRLPGLILIAAGVFSLLLKFAPRLLA